MEQEVYVLNEDKLEEVIEKILLEDNSDLLNYMYHTMTNSNYIRRKMYTKRERNKNVLISRQ
ncbi:MAG: hypothetical protein E7338_02115 [Clostridiales bacterium]|nr:hypothetical protein [Clostridiales bacterium]